MLDTASRSASRAGKALSLTRAEFQLLEALMKQIGHVVRRRELIDAVWGEGVRVDDNNLDVMMSSLRNRVDRGFGRRLIHTVRGLGYRLEPGASKAASAL